VIVDYIANYQKEFGVEPIVDVLNEHGIAIALSMPLRNRVPTITGAAVGVGQGRDLHVQALHAGVAVPDALLGVPVGGPDRVIDVHMRHLVGPTQQRSRVGKVHQQPGGDRI
jgi:hypothetical protein